MQPLEYARPMHRPKWRKAFRIAVASVFILAAAAIIVLIISMRTVKPPPVLRFDSTKVFAERVEPVLRQLREKDDKAAMRAVARIHDHFEQARHGAPEFARSIIGPLDATKTTYLAGKGVFLRWWYEDQGIQPVANHVRWNYEQHVTSGPKLKDAIVGAITRLEQDFRANRNEALQTIGSNLRAAHLPASVEVDQKQLDEFCQREFNVVMLNISSDHPAEKAAIGSAAALALSTAATMIVERAIIYVLGETIAVSGGSVAGGTAGGAAAGSWVPGAGTAIGAAAGLLAGIAVDMWLSHKNEVRTIDQVTKSLTQLEEAIVMGDGNRPGIQTVLGKAAAGQPEQLGAKLKQQLTEAAK